MSADVLRHARLIDSAQLDLPLVVITHDCDIQSDKVEHIEILQGCFKATISGDLLHGKNPRFLQIVNAFGDEQTLELDQSRKILVNRIGSLGIDPIAALRHYDVRLLASWLASRYKRAPFPDSFVERLRHAKTVDRKETNNPKPSA